MGLINWLAAAPKQDARWGGPEREAEEAGSIQELTMAVRGGLKANGTNYLLKDPTR